MSTAVVSTSRKKAPGKSASATTRYDNLPNVREPTHLMDAGGEGRSSLTLDAQATVQLDMYRRTLDLSDLFFRNKEQESRQTKLVDDILHMTVNVAREDFPSISSDVPISYTLSAAQAAWRQFLVDTRVVLNLEFIEDILDKKDMAPVHRIQALRNGGQYFVKQREASAILEVIESGKLPQQLSWPVTQGINIAKDNLLESAKTHEWMDKRVDEIINMPMIRESQRSFMTLLTEADQAQEVLDIIFDVMHEIDLPAEELKIALEKKAAAEEEARIKEEERLERMQAALQKGASAAELMALNSEEPIRPVFIALTTHDPEVDIVLLHRVALESLSRLSKKHPDKLPEMAQLTHKFVYDTVVKFRDEIDIVLLGLKVVGDYCDFNAVNRHEIFVLILDTIQSYAPPPLFYLPRVIHRLLSPEELAEEERMFNLQFSFEEEEDGELQEPVADAEERILAQMAALGVRMERGKEESDDDTTIEAVQEEVKEEEEEEEEVVVVVERKRNLNEKKPWKGSYGFPGKTYVKTLKDRAGEMNFNDFFGGGGGGGGEGGDDDDDEIPGKTRNKMKAKKFTLRPLPTTKGIIHRGFLGNAAYKQSLIMLQSFSVLYQLVSISYGYREEAFNLFLHEEVSDIAVVSVDKPRLLEYAIWIIDKMYSDGFVDQDEANAREGADDAITLDPSMQVSAPAQQPSTSPACDPAAAQDDVSAGPGDDDSIDPVTGMVIEAVSTVTQPSIDLEGVNKLLAPPEVNHGDAEEELVPWTAGPITKEEEPENITVDIALDPEAREREDLAKKLADMPDILSVRKKLGEKSFNRRYRGRPKDIVIIALGLISAHLDVPSRERDMARRLLSIFDDCSLSFKQHVSRGAGLSG